MKSLRHATFVAIFGLVWLVAVSRPAYGHVGARQICAYIDPGTGSFMIQLLIGTALGSLFVVKMFWRRITGFLGGLFGRKPDQVEGRPQGESEADSDPQEGRQDG